VCLCDWSCVRIKTHLATSGSCAILNREFIEWRAVLKRNWETEKEKEDPSLLSCLPCVSHIHTCINGYHPLAELHGGHSGPCPPPCLSNFSEVHGPITHNLLSLSLRYLSKSGLSAVRLLFRTTISQTCIFWYGWFYASNYFGMHINNIILIW